MIDKDIMQAFIDVGIVPYDSFLEELSDKECTITQQNHEKLITMLNEQRHAFNSE